MSAGTGTAQSPSLLTRIGRGGPVTMLGLVLLALLLVFGLLLGDQLFSVGALQSMAFQLPELGILSLAMMAPLMRPMAAATATPASTAMTCHPPHMKPSAPGT